MVMSVKAERSYVSHEEFDFLSQTHYPPLADLKDEETSSALKRVRDLREKERSLTREMRRGIRGKGETRGSSFPGDVEKPARRKQVFAGALKRLNREVTRRRVLAAKEELIAASRRALDLKAAGGDAHHPAPGQSGREGMTPIETQRRRTKVNRARVGQVSQATKTSQAARDARS